MFISQLRVRNFKNLYKNEFFFDRNINTIIGENGTGKTNIFYALRFILENNPRLFFTEEHFTNRLPVIKGQWIILSVKFEDVGESVEEVGLQANEKKEGFFTLIFRPKMIIRTNLHKLSLDAHSETDKDAKKQKFEQLVYYINKIDFRNDYETIKRVSNVFDFLNDDEYKKIVGDFDSLIFPETEIQDNKKLIGNQDSGFSSSINVTFIPAIRDVTNELTNENNFLARILKNISDEVADEEWNKFEEGISNVNNELSKINAFVDFVSNVSEVTKKTVGDVYSTNIELKMEMPNKRTNIVKYFTLKGKEDDAVLGLYNRSLGDNNIIYFALKLVESRLSFGHSKKIFNLMLIEEPEAHIHKFLQESLFSGIRDNNSDYQLMLSTHSVHISESSKISSLIVLDKTDNLIVSYNPSNGLEESTIDYLERYLNVTKTPILFSKCTLIVEGTAELLLIPKLYLLLHNFDISKFGISLISIDGCYFEEISRLFHHDRIRKYSAILTDGDKDFETVESRKEKLAQRRIKNILDLNKENQYVFLSHSEYTFEIDLYRENIGLFKMFLEELEVYKDISLLDELESDDSKISYARITKACELLGKGNIAFKFGKWLDDNQEALSVLKIPDYIHHAIIYLISNFLTDEQYHSFVDFIAKNSDKYDNSRDEFLVLLLGI